MQIYLYVFYLTLELNVHGLFARGTYNRLCPQGRGRDVGVGPEPALPLQQPLITKNFTSRAFSSVICLFKHAGSFS